VPFSIELEGDYEGLLTELGRLIAEAKDVLESDAFYNGLAANNAPIGVLATTGGLPVGRASPRVARRRS
jgi:hypothetical protein